MLAASLDGATISAQKVTNGKPYSSNKYSQFDLAHRFSFTQKNGQHNSLPGQEVEKSLA
jgi:hypothetical protein